MGDIAIKIENVSKEYKIGVAKRYDTLGEQMAEAFKGLFGRNGHRQRSHQSDTIWALKDVSFEVKKGEVVGVIGRNGAGKSTLLKILSRITEPTEGRVGMCGRVGSLLEVGTGFHAELTGRENIYLSGAMLGMSKAEIARKFDEIVAFSEIEQFLDTPVKRYSSGMYVRLAFAVAAHLEPEILIVDEVLAVGDFAFQNKCLGKMGDVAKAGRTVLFVSHNLKTVLNLCVRGVLLESGRVQALGLVDSVVRAYLAGNQNPQQVNLTERTDRKGDGRIRFTDFWLENQAGERVSTVRSGDSVSFVFEYACRDNAVFPRGLNTTIILRDSLDQPIFMLSPECTRTGLRVHRSGGRWSCKVDSLPLLPDRYTAFLWFGVGQQNFDWIEKAATFDVVEGDFFGSGLHLSAKHKFGPFLVRQEWRVVE
jgi:homopolymeric O-antigen transport system ATP-binding protein